MLLRRCAWHRTFHGYPLVYGIASWRKWRITFTDGMCRRCSTAVRRRLALPSLAVEDRPARRIGLRPGSRVAVTLVAAVAVMLMALPLVEIFLPRQSGGEFLADGGVVGGLASVPDTSPIDLSRGARALPQGAEALSQEVQGLPQGGQGLAREAEAASETKPNNTWRSRPAARKNSRPVRAAAPARRNAAANAAPAPVTPRSVAPDPALPPADVRVFTDPFSWREPVPPASLTIQTR